MPGLRGGLGRGQPATFWVSFLSARSCQMGRLEVSCWGAGGAEEGLTEERWSHTDSVSTQSEGNPGIWAQLGKGSLLWPQRCVLPSPPSVPRVHGPSPVPQGHCVNSRSFSTQRCSQSLSSVNRWPSPGSRPMWVSQLTADRRGPGGPCFRSPRPAPVPCLWGGGLMSQGLLEPAPWLPPSQGHGRRFPSDPHVPAGSGAP